MGALASPLCSRFLSASLASASIRFWATILRCSSVNGAGVVVVDGGTTNGGGSGERRGVLRGWISITGICEEKV